MPTVQPYDPQALPLLTELAGESAQKLARLLKRKQLRADELLGKEQVSEADLKGARALEHEIDVIVEVVQAYKQIIQQHESESDTRWGMIEILDRRANAWKKEAEKNAAQFERLRAAFEAFINHQSDSKNSR